MSLEFLQRALGYAQELNERSGVLSSVALRDVGRHGNGGPTDLGCHAEGFLSREAVGQGVAILRYRHGVLPHPEITIGADPLAAAAFPFHSPFAIRHSPYLAFSSPGST